MRTPLIVCAAAVGALQACVGDSLEASGTTPSDGGGSDSGGPSDAEPPADGGADTAPVTFCTAQGAAFCEDFDRTGGALTALAPTWTSPATSGTSLLASPGATVDSSPYHVQLAVGATTATAPFGQRLAHLDTSVQTLPGIILAHANIKVLMRATPFVSTDAFSFRLGNQRFYLALNGTDPSTFVPGVVYIAPDKSARTVFGNNAALTVPYNEWFKIDFVVTTGASATFKASLNGTSMPRADADAGTAPTAIATPSDTSFTVDIGPSGNGDHGAIAVAYDNVLVQTQ